MILPNPVAVEPACNSLACCDLKGVPPPAEAVAVVYGGLPNIDAHHEKRLRRRRPFIEVWS